MAPIPFSAMGKNSKKRALSNTPSPTKFSNENPPSKAARPTDTTQGEALPGGANPGVPTQGDAIPGVPTPGDVNPGVPTPGDVNPGVPTPGDVDPGVPTPGDASPGDASPGGANPGDITVLQAPAATPALEAGASEGEPSSQNSQAVDFEHEIQALLERELSSIPNLDSQSKAMVSLNVRITSKIISMMNAQRHSCCSDKLVISACDKKDDEIKDHSDKLKVLELKVDQSMKDKDKQITKLNNVIDGLQNSVKTLQSDLALQKYETDSIDQYERRDSLIFSGDSVPAERNGENVTEMVLDFLRQELFLHLSPRDINVCHRLGRKKLNHKRPIICKFISRTVKTEIKQRCLDLKPTLYANESLTAMRREIFTRLRLSRKKLVNTPYHFSQLYTNDGKIMIKLKNSEQKIMINNPIDLQQFLDKYPEIKTVHSSIILK